MLNKVKQHRISIEGGPLVNACIYLRSYDLSVPVTLTLTQRFLYINLT